MLGVAEKTLDIAFLLILSSQELLNDFIGVGLGARWWRALATNGVVGVAWLHGDGGRARAVVGAAVGLLVEALENLGFLVVERSL